MPPDRTSTDSQSGVEAEATVAPFADQLLKAKLESLAEFAAGAGHEINNPLATILGRIDLLGRRLKEQMSPGEVSEFRRDLMIIAAQAHRVRDMIGDLMLFARPPSPTFAKVDLRGLAREVSERFRSSIDARQIHFEIEASEASWVDADRVQVCVVISELLRNALHAVNDGGRIRLAVTSSVEKYGSGGRLRLEDDGIGLTETDREHLFDPFYSGRSAGRGLGFGLCKCWRIMQQHGGTIEVHPRLERGVTADVWFPSIQASL